MAILDVSQKPQVIQSINNRRRLKTQRRIKERAVTPDNEPVIQENYVYDEVFAQSFYYEAKDTIDNAAVPGPAGKYADIQNMEKLERLRNMFRFSVYV